MLSTQRFRRGTRWRRKRRRRRLLGSGDSGQRALDVRFQRVLGLRLERGGHCGFPVNHFRRGRRRSHLRSGHGRRRDSNSLNNLGFLGLRLRNWSQHGRRRGHRRSGHGRRRDSNSLNNLGFRRLRLRNRSLRSERSRFRHSARTQLDANARGCGVNVKGGISVQVCHHPHNGAGRLRGIVRCEQSSEPPCRRDSYSERKYSERPQYRPPSAPGWATSSPDRWHSGKWRHPQKSHRTHACRRLLSKQAGARWRGWEVGRRAPRRERGGSRSGGSRGTDRMTPSKDQPQL